VRAVNDVARELGVGNETLRNWVNKRRRAPVTSRFRFISAHRAEYGTKRLCQVLAVSAAGFYRWVNAEPARQARAAADDVAAGQIRAVHEQSRGA